MSATRPRVGERGRTGPRVQGVAMAVLEELTSSGPLGSIEDSAVELS
jgi:hypothetical protein